MVQRSHFEIESFVKIRDALFDYNDEFTFPTKDIVQGYCWAGAVTTAYSFHADEFDAKSLENCEVRWQYFKLGIYNPGILAASFRSLKLSQKNYFSESEKKAHHKKFTELLDLKIFIQLLELHQHQEYYAEFFSSENCPGRADFKTLMKWLSPVSLDKFGSLVLAKFYSNICTPKEIKTFFSKIDTKFIIENIRHRVSFIVTTINHAVFIGYSPMHDVKPTWCLFDIRHGTKYFKYESDLVKKIATYFDNENSSGSNELEIYVLTIGNYKNTLLKVLTELDSDPYWQAWNEVTSDKVARRSLTQIQWITSAVRGGDMAKVKELLNQNQFESPLVALVCSHLDLAKEMLIFYADKEKKENKPNGTYWNKKVLVDFYHEERRQRLIDWVVEFAFDNRLKKLNWLNLLIELQLEKTLEFAIQKNKIGVIQHIFLVPQYLNSMLVLAYHHKPEILKWLVTNLNGHYLKKILDWAITNIHEFPMLTIFAHHNAFEKLFAANLDELDVQKIIDVMKANHFDEEVKMYAPKTKKVSFYSRSFYLLNSNKTQSAPDNDILEKKHICSIF